MKTIVLDARMIFSGGIGTYIRNLIAQLHNCFCHLKLIVHPSVVKENKWLQGFDLIYCSSGIYSIKEQLKLPFIIPKSDVFWSPHFNIPLLPISAKKRLVTIHDLYHLDFLSDFSFREKIYAKIMIQQALIRSDRVITVSEFTKNRLEHFYPSYQEKIRMILLGINFDFSIDDHQLKSIREQFALPEHFFLFVGNIKKHKNLKGLIEAFHLFHQRDNPSISLIIIGEDRNFRYRETLSSVIDRYPHLRSKIFWLKNISDIQLRYFYRLATALIFPSFYEGFGLPPLEAMACGCPVIVSDVASLPQVCKNAALYCNPHQIESIVHRMEEIAKDENKRNELIEKGLLRARECSWEKTAQNHLAVIEELIFSK